MLSKSFFKKTEFVFIILLSTISIVAVLTIYFAFSIYFDKEMEKYKRGYYTEQAYKLSYYIGSHLQAGFDGETPTGFYEDLTQEFSVNYELYTENDDLVYASSPMQEKESDNNMQVDAPIIIQGQQIGYLLAHYDLEHQIVSPSLLNHEKRIKKQLGTLAIVVLLILLILSLIVTIFVAKPIRKMLKSILQVLRGKRDVTIPRAGTLEMEYMVDSLNSVLIEFRNMENWRGQMMQDLTHELRTPLTSILIMMEAIIDGVYPASKDVLEDMYAEVERLSRLIFNVQNLSEAESARFRLRVRKSDITTLVKNTYEGFLFMAKEKNIKLQFKHPQRPCVAEVDPDRFIQVITNLLSNALQYTPKSGKVEVGVDKFQNEIYVYCLDNGVGMSEEDQTLIFNRFYRADKSRSQENGGSGSGIGLNISNALAEAHGWEIDVESELNKGSRFWVKIPTDNDVNRTEPKIQYGGS